MMIRFACATCGERLSVPDAYAGRKGACPNCKGINRVPQREEGAAAMSSGAVPQAEPMRREALRAQPRGPDLVERLRRRVRIRRKTPTQTAWSTDERLPLGRRMLVLILALIVLPSIIWLLFYFIVLSGPSLGR